jgi:hypothetical protein
MRPRLLMSVALLLLLDCNYPYQGEKGHLELSATWQRIIVAIERLQAEKPNRGSRCSS